MSQDTLPVVAGKAVALLNKAQSQRATAAVLIAEAKRRVDAGEPVDGEVMKWRQFCLKYIPRSDREIRKLVAAGRSGDADGYLDKIRATEAKAQKSLRKRRADASPHFPEENQPLTSKAADLKARIAESREAEKEPNEASAREDSWEAFLEAHSRLESVVKEVVQIARSLSGNDQGAAKDMIAKTLGRIAR